VVGTANPSPPSPFDCNTEYPVTNAWSPVLNDRPVVEGSRITRHSSANPRNPTTIEVSQNRGISTHTRNQGDGLASATHSHIGVGGVPETMVRHIAPPHRPLISIRFAWPHPIAPWSLYASLGPTPSPPGLYTFRLAPPHRPPISIRCAAPPTGPDIRAQLEDINSRMREPWTNGIAVGNRQLLGVGCESRTRP